MTITELAARDLAERQRLHLLAITETRRELADSAARHGQTESLERYLATLTRKA